MRGEDQVHPKTAMGFARRDRRAQKEAENVLANTTNAATHQEDAKAIPATINSHNLGAGVYAGSNKENAGPATGGQQEKSGTTNKKKKWVWNKGRRPRKTSGNAKAHEDKAANAADSAAESKENADGKGEVKVHERESSEETAVEDHAAEVDGVAAVQA